jgi:hypothetical protein
MGQDYLTEAPAALEHSYAVEEREREITVLRERRKAQDEKAASPPTTLLKALSHSNMISSRDIREKSGFVTYWKNFFTRL